MKQEHPLRDISSKWTFNQPYVGFNSGYLVVSKETGDRATHTIAALNTCREGVIENTRSGLQTHLTNLKEVQKTGWRDKSQWVVQADVDLTEKKGVKTTELKIQWYDQWMPNWPAGLSQQEKIAQFLQVCDIVLGPVCVLLGPWRKQGSWWKTDPEEARKTQSGGDCIYIHWKGSDNWFLAHPATVGIVTALYRQCYHLCGAGLAEEIIELVDQDEIDEVMSTNSQKLALQLTKRTRPYIEVPAARNASRVNYAFALGSWRRLIRLQRAIRRHGYEKALGQDFAEGWNLVGKARNWTGLWRFWGDEGELTEHHRHLMDMGAPRRKKSG